MTPRLALIALMTLPLAACEGVTLPGMGAGSETAAAAPGHRGPPGVSPLEQAIETGDEARPVSTAEASTYNTPAFSARGNEPFWAVDVAGSTAIYKTPDNQSGQPIRVNRLNFAQGVEYVGVRGGRPFVLNVRAAECTDSMSGDRFPFTARLTVSGQTQAGCAAPAAPEIAQAVAATRAPAPAAPRQAAPRPAAARPAPASTPAAETAPAAPAAPAAEPATAPAAEPAASPSQPSTATPSGAGGTPASEGTAELPPPPAAEAPASVVPPITVLPPLTTGGATPDTTTDESQ
ncbi:hypothetical protein EYE42_05260 [Paracoccus subflavus]|uniref:Uncharacterized protein n=1 Tax=Paracoccus subflavus TaxID=2528244 RepID=A0A4Q9G3I5_9RHOB|nr:hypothetical protein [Paracoccus subflavus]TBN41815.1 hypothetical protein EYE42_05260 [Paracoccus subflavus]